MHLHEEYYTRHGLSYPVVKRPDDKMTLLYRADAAKWKTQWVVLQISKKPEAYHPYYYQVGLYAPVPNGSTQGGGALAAAGEIKRVEWDEYDQELVNMACQNLINGLTPVVDLSEAKLAVWEIFLLTADDKMADCGSDILLDIMRSIDVDATIEDRMQSQERVAENFQRAGSSLHARWENLRSFYDPSYYAVWFAELIEKMRDDSYREGFGDLKSVAQ